MSREDELLAGRGFSIGSHLGRTIRPHVYHLRPRDDFAILFELGLLKIIACTI